MWSLQCIFFVEKSKQDYKNWWIDGLYIEMVVKAGLTVLNLYVTLYFDEA